MKLLQKITFNSKIWRTAGRTVIPVPDDVINDFSTEGIEVIVTIEPIGKKYTVIE